MTSCRGSIASNTSLPSAKIYTTVGIYKGSRVAIKKITKKKIDITKKLLWEIKQVILNFFFGFINLVVFLG